MRRLAADALTREECHAIGLVEQQEPPARAIDGNQAAHGVARELEAASRGGCRRGCGRRERVSGTPAAEQGGQALDDRIDESPAPGTRPAERQPELELHGVGVAAEAGQPADERTRVITMALGEELEQILAPAAGVADADRRCDAARFERAHEGCERAGDEGGRYARSRRLA